jgi:glucose-1-phosphate thymidylyltransferase
MFLPIGDSTVINRIFDALEEDERVDDVLVSTNERFAPEFEEYLASSEYDKPRISVEETRAEGEKFGVVGALAELVERENLTEDTLVIAGDNVISFDLESFVDCFEETGRATLAAYDVGNEELASQYGVLELDGDRVVDFQEKPEEPKSTLASIACYMFPGDSLPLLEEYLAGENNPDEPGWFVQWLQNRDPVDAVVFEDAWFDIGTPESYLNAVAWQLDGENRIAPSATVENAEIGQNVHLMADVTVRDATIDHSVVFPEATIEGSEVRDSIVDEHAHVENVALRDSLVGSHSEVIGDG